MSESRFDANDPRLTAYVLGELDETERAAVERQLEECAQSRNAVEEIRNLTGLLSEQLPSEPAPALTEAQRETVVAEAEKVAVAANVTPPRRRQRWMLITAVSTLSAAGLLVSLSPAFRAEIQSVSKKYLFTESVEGEIENSLLALNESSEGQFKKASRSVNRHDVNGSNYSSMYAGGGDPGKTTDLSRVEDLKITAGGGFSEWESLQRGGGIGGGGGFGAAGPTTAGTNAGSTVTNEQSRDSQKYNFYVPVTGVGESGTRAPSRREPGTRPNIANQPSFGPSFRRRSVRADKFLDTWHKVELEHVPFPSEPSINLPSYFDPAATGVTPQQITSPLPPGIAGNLGDGVAAGRGKEEGGGGIQADFESLKGLIKIEIKFDDQNNTEAYAPIIENEFLSPLKAPLATFGIDVDTAAYSNVRRFLNQGRLPPPNAVRIEELVNYFHYDEPQPAGDDPFSVSLEAADCPWNPGHRLVRIGLKGKEIDRSQRPHSNLVFLIDVSGSMDEANKLPLVKTALEMLVQQMTENDRIAIVTYASEAALKLDSTNGHNKDAILKAIRSLQASGSTNGEAGIQLAYAKAYEHRIKNGTNRVILCTDGDFNVGVSDDDQLMQMVHKYADQSGVFLSIFGFGMGNLKDAKLEKLADKGNGHYGYIDNKQEAHKVFVEELTGTLYTIAKDLKLQIEFNPYQVGAYRLIGYENRLLAAEDFDDDRKDAGDVGAGHSVTALFEIIPLDKLRQPVELKYQKVSRVKLDASDVDQKQAASNRELLTLFLRYKQPDAKTSVKREYPLADIPNDSASGTPSENLQWSAAVAAFGMLIRDSQYRGHANYDLVSELALSAKGKDESGRRKEFLQLVNKAQTIHKQLLGLNSSTSKEVLPSEPQGKQNTPASENPPLEIGKNVEYWQTHQTNGNDAAKVIKVLKVLFPNMKTKPGANPGTVIILAQKSHHAKLADLLPRMTLD